MSIEGILVGHVTLAPTGPRGWFGVLAPPDGRMMLRRAGHEARRPRATRTPAPTMKDNVPPVFRLTRPDAAQLDAFLATQRDAPFTYAEVGATRGAAYPAGYVVDRRRVRIGTGAAAYARAVQALRAWRMTALGWASVHPAPAPLVPGATVAVVVRHYGFWSMHAARIVYVLDEIVPADGADVHRFGFAYGTLPAHAASGEERFVVEWRRADDGVWYDLSAFSRPRHPLARLGRPLARWQQRRFGRASTRAMADAVDDAPRAATRDAAGAPAG